MLFTPSQTSVTSSPPPRRAPCAMPPSSSFFAVLDLLWSHERLEPNPSYGFRLPHTLIFDPKLKKPIWYVTSHPKKGRRTSTRALLRRNRASVDVGECLGKFSLMPPPSTSTSSLLSLQPHRLSCSFVGFVSELDEGQSEVRIRYVSRTDVVQLWESRHPPASSLPTASVVTSRLMLQKRTFQELSTLYRVSWTPTTLKTQSFVRNLGTDSPTEAPRHLKRSAGRARRHQIWPGSTTWMRRIGVMCRSISDRIRNLSREVLHVTKLTIWLTFASGVFSLLFVSEIRTEESHSRGSRRKRKRKDPLLSRDRNDEVVNAPVNFRVRVLLGQEYERGELGSTRMTQPKHLCVLCRQTFVKQLVVRTQVADLFEWDSQKRSMRSNSLSSRTSLPSLSSSSSSSSYSSDPDPIVIPPLIQLAFPELSLPQFRQLRRSRRWSRRSVILCVDCSKKLRQNEAHRLLAEERHLHAIHDRVTEFFQRKSLKSSPTTLTTATTTIGSSNLHHHHPRRFSESDQKVLEHFQHIRQRRLLRECAELRMVRESRISNSRLEFLSRPIHRKKRRKFHRPAVSRAATFRYCPWLVNQKKNQQRKFYSRPLLEG